ncbi:transketolase, putative, partial [Ichthyophthirius multifiliis]
KPQKEKMNTRHSRQQKPSTSPLKKQKSPEKKDPKPQKKLKTTEDYQNIQNIKDIAARLRIHSIEMTNASNSGHPSSCSSMADILSVLFFDKSGMTINIQNLKSFTADRFVLSKGHAAPILYAVWSLVGLIPQSELLKIRKFSSGLEGHPTPRLPFVDVATGSLGQGLGAACGMAYSSKYLDKITNRFYVLLGDGECAEGSVWEAASFAGHYKLDNLTAIVDVNRLGQSEETSLAHNVQSYKKRFESFDWNAIVIDGQISLQSQKPSIKPKIKPNNPQYQSLRPQKEKISHLQKINQNGMENHQEKKPKKPQNISKIQQKIKILHLNQIQNNQPKIILQSKIKQNYNHYHIKKEKKLQLDQHMELHQKDQELQIHINVQYHQMEILKIPLMRLHLKMLSLIDLLNAIQLNRIWFQQLQVQVVEIKFPSYLLLVLFLPELMIKLEWVLYLQLILNQWVHIVVYLQEKMVHLKWLWKIQL